jgi:nucleoside-diphosphate-sugar epimerase
MTDAGLLARATVWAATDERAANQAFNVNNGDLFRWSEMWPRTAGWFDLEVAPPLPMTLEVVMADKEPVWNTMVERHALASHGYDAVSSWRFGDAVFGWDYDMFADGSKLRRLGFHEQVDTAAMFADVFEDFRRRGVIPG